MPRAVLRQSAFAMSLFSSLIMGLMVLQSFSGFFRGTSCFYMAFDQLSVVEKTLMIIFTISVTALWARALLEEAQPCTVPFSRSLISCGLLLAIHACSHYR